MRESTHAATGAVIGMLITNPAAAFVAGMASHLYLDTFPHLDPGHYGRQDEDGRYREFPNYVPLQKAAMAIDFVAMFALIGWLWATRGISLSVGSAIFGAVLPDILLLLPRVGFTVFNQKWFAWFHHLHHDVHFRITWNQRVWSWHNELIIFVLSLWWLIAYRQ